VPAFNAATARRPWGTPEKKVVANSLPNFNAAIALRNREKKPEKNSGGTVGKQPP
jgi:hypothetical protein